MLDSPVDQRTPLLARIRSTMGDIDAAQRALAKVDVEQRLVGRVQGRIDRAFRHSRDRMDRLERDVAAAGDATPVMAALWQQYRGLTDELRPVREECLAFIEGILLRNRRLDDDVCEVADELLDELSGRCGIPWERFTILAAGAFFTSLADVIRLPFPAAGVWDLPVAAHEFGHLAGPEMKTPTGRRPFGELLESEAAPIELPRGASYEDYLHEYCADVFATETLGPCYPAMCLLLRFDPARADVDGERHPSPSKRAYVMLRALESLDTDRLRKPFASVASALRAAWAASVAGAGGSAEPSDPQRLKLDDVYDRLDAMLRSALEPDAIYQPAWWRRAEDIADGLRAAEPSIAASDSAQLADAVNGAWLYRIEQEGTDQAALRVVSRAALGSCRAIAQRRADREAEGR